MKVQITKESKKWMTIAEAEKTKEIAASVKDDSLTDFCEMAINIAAGHGTGFEILKPSAKFAGNARIYDWYADGSGKLDIWIECYAFNPFYGFYEVGAYYTDIIEADGTDATAARLRSHMFINHYRKEN